MQQGAAVTIRDGSGEVIASSRLGAGTGESAEVVALCNFNFVVIDVPDTDFYSIEVGHRGEVNYSRQELERSDWKVELSLGD